MLVNSDDVLGQIRITIMFQKNNNNIKINYNMLLNQFEIQPPILTYNLVRFILQYI